MTIEKAKFTNPYSDSPRFLNKIGVTTITAKIFIP
jgi:hypothetical protein